MIWDSSATNQNLSFTRIHKLNYFASKLHLATVYPACVKESATQKMVPFLFYLVSEWLQLSPMTDRIPLIFNSLKETYLDVRQ